MSTPAPPPDRQSPPVPLRVDSLRPQRDRIARAARVLQDGGLVAFPTETVYGLGANALNPLAVGRIYLAKGRPAWNPVIVHVATIADARALVTTWTDDAEQLARAFWPGPLTLLLPKRDIVPDVASAGLPVIGVRVPNHAVALALLRAAQCPIAAPSANRFTRISPTSAQHVVDSLGHNVDLILDGGPCTVGIESTVLDLAGAVPTVLRPGMISRTQIAAVLGRDVRDGSAHAVAADTTNAGQRAPGMADRHYAPRADVWLFDAAQWSEITRAITARTTADGALTALLRTVTLPVGATDRVIRMPAEPTPYAQQLYAALHAADTAGAAVIVIERPPRDEAWAAIRNRLERSSR